MEEKLERLTRDLKKLESRVRELEEKSEPNNRYTVRAYCGMYGLPFDVALRKRLADHANRIAETSGNTIDSPPDWEGKPVDVYPEWVLDYGYQEMVYESLGHR